MKIGIDIRNIGKQRTGDEVVFLNLVRNLAKIDNENKYFLFTDIANKNFIEKITNELQIENNDNFKIVALKPLFGIKSFFNKFIWNLWILPDYLRHHKFDIYHTQYIIPFFVPARTKVVNTIHDISFKVHPDFIPPTDLIFLNLLIPRSLKNTTRIIAVSEFTKREIIKYYSVEPEKIIVAPNALDRQWINALADKNEFEFIKSKYGLPEKYILYLGTLQPRKNLPFLLQAYAKIRNKIPDIKLVIAGKTNAHNIDPEIESAIKQYKLENDVLFPGYIDEEDKKLLYRCCHLAIFPSIYEGFGIPLLEAMSQKVPVLAADIPAHREVAGETVIYYRQFDLANFKEKLYNACIDEKLRQSVTRLGFERVQFFSWRKSTTIIHETYLGIMNEKTK
jgi:glycosyltransferase involved in cell wall biosynthesis